MRWRTLTATRRSIQLANEITVYEYTDADELINAPIEPATVRTTVSWTVSHDLNAKTRYVVIKATSASYVRITAAGTAPTSADYAIAAGDAVMFPIVRNTGGNGLKVHAITQ